MRRVGKNSHARSLGDLRREIPTVIRGDGVLLDLDEDVEEAGVLRGRLELRRSPSAGGNGATRLRRPYAADEQRDDGVRDVAIRVVGDCRLEAETPPFFEESRRRRHFLDGEVERVRAVIDERNLDSFAENVGEVRDDVGLAETARLEIRKNEKLLRVLIRFGEERDGAGDGGVEVGAPERKRGVLDCFPKRGAIGRKPRRFGTRDEHDRRLVAFARAIDEDARRLFGAVKLRSLRLERLHAERVVEYDDGRALRLRPDRRKRGRIGRGPRERQRDERDYQRPQREQQPLLQLHPSDVPALEALEKAQRAELDGLQLA